MKNVLVCWIGITDLNAPGDPEHVGLGPTAQAVQARSYDEVVIVSDYPEVKVSNYIKWLRDQTPSEIVVYYVKLSGPTNFGEIYETAAKVVSSTLQGGKDDISLTFHLSPGTPAMASVWIILAKTRFPAELIESSKENGVRTASVPFDISADFIPELLRKPDKRLQNLSAGLPPEAPEFADIIHRSQIMEKVIVKARRVAPRSVPVLIEGESGTGKELLARAIHKASPRRSQPFITVNCGAIPAELMESELFGHEKGAFTGADRQRIGYFEAADSGTLFLDEVAELPLSAQVKLLRALQEEEITRLGATQPIKVNVRIISATNSLLLDEISKNRFRPDLFYRLAVAVLHLPPLRNRPGDLSLLIDKLLEQTNRESKEEPGYVHKKITPSARNLMLNHDWPGNIRELQNTILRAAVWSGGSSIGKEDIEDALIPQPDEDRSDLLNKALGDGFNLLELMKVLAQHYLKKALGEAHGNKTKAARLLGLPNYQTLSNWMKKYDIK